MKKNLPKTHLYHAPNAVARCTRKDLRAGSGSNARNADSSIHTRQGSPAIRQSTACGRWSTTAKECKPTHKGRFFKAPDADDLDRYTRARLRLQESPGLPIPDDEIPPGDETDRLHRWGYRRYREMFTERQLLGLGLLLRRITQVSNSPVRHALLTVFSDFLRYQNMLCRYDTYALKCQDIFSVHGFPVGLIQCENKSPWHTQGRRRCLSPLRRESTSGPSSTAKLPSRHV